MRADHYAYQRATRVAMAGLIIQVIFGLALLLFGILGQDGTMTFASYYVFQGVWVWLGLVVIFQQHRQERLEALEQDELSAAKAAGESFFDEEDEVRVQRKRLQLMHKWLMPVVSFIVAGLLAFSAWRIFVFMGDEETALSMTDHLGWALGICLSASVLCFVFSRFVSGMAKQAAWQNLRGGAGFMVGNALIFFAIAIGLVFRFIENDRVIEIIAWAIPVFMLIASAEILLNLLLNFYRPRIPGEVPRPAFDSKLLSLLAAPDSIVRSLNEAVNYQFGFDITSSWGYQLLIRSFFWLVGFAVLVLILLNMVVIVEPHQQAIRLRGGQIVGHQQESGAMFKWPWPIESAEIYEVSRIRELALTPRQRQMRPRGEVPAGTEGLRVDLWTHDMEDLYGTAENQPDPIIVGGRMTPAGIGELEAAIEEEDLEGLIEEALDQIDDETIAPVEVLDPRGISRRFALVDAEIVLRYRIKDEPGALLNYLNFSNEIVPRRRQSMIQLTIQKLAMREVTRLLPQMTLDEVLSAERHIINERLRSAIQEAFDRYNTGLEAVAVNLPLLRPAGEAAREFEGVAFDRQIRRRAVMEAWQSYETSLVGQAGSVEMAERLASEIDRLSELRRLRDTSEEAAEEYLQQRRHIEALIRQASGSVALPILRAEAESWMELMELRSRVAELVGEQHAFGISPEIYMQRRWMEMLADTLKNVNKTVSVIDPRRIRVDMELDDASHAFSPIEGMTPEDEDR